MKKMHRIHIEEDGWVWIEMTDGNEIGLGDLGSDVLIDDLRTPVKSKRARLQKEARALRRKGLTLRRIGKNLGISFETARKYINHTKER